ncbi:unnamed protein product [Urochloa decumbens]|uniref:DUF6598 domain-containing protein n=1 Tax=Urochloa decumbens TaxID=240449 RepID=A0ABC8YQL2_9POAL
MEPASMPSAREDKDHGTEDITAKTPHVEDEEVEEQGLEDLNAFRRFWIENMSPFFGSLEETTGPDLGPMRYTDSGPPRCGIPYSAVEIFSLKVSELKGEKGGLQWPLRVFGLVAVRDSRDHRRNILFQRSKDNCQVLTAEDSSLVLTGPSRAIALIDPPEFEVELRAIGARPSEEKLLCGVCFDISNRSSHKFGQVQTCTESGKRCTIELKFSQLGDPLEATIEVRLFEGSSDFRGRFFAHTEYMGEEDNVVLLDSTDRRVAVESDGRIILSRRVVLVEEGAKLVLGVKAWQSGDGKGAVEYAMEFPARLHSRSNGFLNVGLCEMSVSVAWSVLC